MKDVSENHEARLKAFSKVRTQLGKYQRNPVPVNYRNSDAERLDERRVREALTVHGKNNRTVNGGLPPADEPWPDEAEAE